MKKLVVVAAFALAGFMAQAAACELDRRANATPVIVADSAIDSQHQQPTVQDPKACEGAQCNRAAEPAPQHTVKGGQD
jgi:anti-sigma-K factor RskA